MKKIVLLLVLGLNFLYAQNDNKKSLEEIHLDMKNAEIFAELALKCVQKEFPNKLDHVMNNEGEVKSPFQLHPAFFGCFE